MLTEEQIKAMIPDLESTVKQHVKEQILTGIKNSMTWQLQETIGKCVKDFMEKEIVPEIQAHLISSKDGLRKSVIEATVGMTEILKKTLVEKFSENLKGYRAGEILKRMFE